MLQSMGSQRHNLATEQQQRNSSIDKIQVSSVQLFATWKLKFKGEPLYTIIWHIVPSTGTSWYCTQLPLTGHKRSQGLNSTLLQVYIERGEIPAILRARRR